MAQKIIVGIDVGSLETKITLGQLFDNEIVRNRHGGHTTPTAVTFQFGRARSLGEDAAANARADENTVTMLDRLLVDSLCDEWRNNDELALFHRFRLSDEGQVYIPSMGKSYSTAAILAMLLGSVKTNAIATIARLSNIKEVDEETEKRLQFNFAVPPSYPETTREAMRDAAFATGLNSSVVDSTMAMAAVYQKKFSLESKEKVLVVDVGHARTTIAVLSGTSSEKETNGSGGGEKTVEVLAHVSSSTLGAGLIDLALYHHFLSNHPSLSKAPKFEPNSRKAQRLLEGCNKLKHLLSMLNKSSVMVENIGQNETDVNLTADRDLLQKLCQGVLDNLARMVQTVVEKAGGSDALGDEYTVEITGGGTRVPCIQSAVNKALCREASAPFSRSFDDTALAFGASLIGTTVSNNEVIDPKREAIRAQLLEDENALRIMDDELIRKDELRNRIETHVLELRSARHSMQGSLLPTGEEFNTYLNETDSWLFSEECDKATSAQMEDKWKSFETWMDNKCADYLVAKKTEAEEKDRQMEAEAKLAAAEREAEGSDEEADDHDTRRLSVKRRMEIVQKNKKEANELFAGGNYRHAAARYQKALTHCSKFFDLSPDEEEQVKTVKLSLYLNLGLTYTKLDKLENALQNANYALELDSNSVKALYRRATVLTQKRKFDVAMKDLKVAEELAPEDKAVMKLKKTVEAQIAKQKKKEKAMAKKMFS